MEMGNIIDWEETCVLGICASLEPSIYKIMVYSAGKVSIEQRTRLSSIYIIIVPWVSNIPYFNTFV